MTFNDLSSPAALMATRRSAKPRDLVAPGPDADQLGRILAAATRVPDHGKLAPWRFVVVPQDRRDAFAALLQRAYAEQRTAGKTETAAIEQFAHQAPCLIVAISAPAHASTIPLWEQELSAGAACMNLLIAAQAEGFGGGWLTGWAAYSTIVRDAFAGSHDRVAGFLFLGTPGRPLEERPRPEPAAVIREWRGESDS